MKYSIGEFAKKLGVTPDFIKYCVKVGVITPDIASNGYRSFDFRQATGVIEYIRMQNLGYTAREIENMMHDENAFEGIVQQSAELRRKSLAVIKFQNELLKYYDFIEYASTLIHKGKCWEVKNVPGMYFLPHSEGHVLSEEKELMESLRSWTSCLPVVCSAMHISGDSDSNDQIGRWGFLVPKESAENLGLDVSRYVESVPACRALVVYGHEYVYRSGMKLADYAYEIMRKMELKNANEMYYIVISRNGPIEDHVNYAMIIVPFESLDDETR